MEELEQRLFETLRNDIASNRLLLPSLPEIAQRVRELTNRPDCSVGQLAEVIAHDPTISARLLKVANSAGLHATQPISTVQAAVSRLGINLVRSLVTQLCILQIMGSASDRRQMRAFVEAGLRIGAICHVFAKHHRHLNPEQAMLAGLVHDMGKLPLRTYMERIPNLKDNEALRMQILMRMHTRVGGLLLESWKFPPELVRVAEEHEDLRRDPARQPDYTDLVIAANIEYYGVEQGRYVGLDAGTVPALRKVWPEDRAAVRSEIAGRLAITERGFLA